MPVPLAANQHRTRGVSPALVAAVGLVASVLAGCGETPDEPSSSAVERDSEGCLKELGEPSYVLSFQDLVEPSFTSEGLLVNPDGSGLVLYNVDGNVVDAALGNLRVAAAGEDGWLVKEAGSPEAPRDVAYISDDGEEQWRLPEVKIAGGAIVGDDVYLDTVDGSRSSYDVDDGEATDSWKDLPQGEGTLFGYAYPSSRVWFYDLERADSSEYDTSTRDTVDLNGGTPPTSPKPCGDTLVNFVDGQVQITDANSGEVLDAAPPAGDPGNWTLFVGPGVIGFSAISTNSADANPTTLSVWS